MYVLVEITISCLNWKIDYQTEAVIIVELLIRRKWKILQMYVNFK